MKRRKMKRKMKKKRKTTGPVV
uniref:Uncharacterized protein n=1 Tax=Timema douglasi TaxID=61478 RepID=A0A7R8VYJ9_TIMDO|nr:unnamed protein product [Timema douglasi]